MSLINSSSFGNLADVSVSINNIKIPTKFFNVSISGKRRGKMNQGYLQCPVKFDDGGTGDFFVLNADNVYFLPLYPPFHYLFLLDFYLLFPPLPFLQLYFHAFLLL